MLSLNLKGSSEICHLLMTLVLNESHDIVLHLISSKGFLRISVHWFEIKRQRFEIWKTFLTINYHNIPCLIIILCLVNKELLNFQYVSCLEIFYIQFNDCKWVVCSITRIYFSSKHFYKDFRHKKKILSSLFCRFNSYVTRSNVFIFLIVIMSYMH